jgi:hypothetical protein
MSVNKNLHSKRAGTCSTQAESRAHELLDDKQCKWMTGDFTGGDVAVLVL